MNKHTIGILEYKRVAGMIAGYCISEEAAERCIRKEPSAVRSAIEQAKQLGDDFLQALAGGTAPQIHRLPPLQASLEKLSTAGICLDIEELYAIGLLTEYIRCLKDWCKHQKTDRPLYRFITDIPCVQGAADAVFKIIDIHGELKDIPALTAIKHKIGNIEEAITKLMKSYCTDEETCRMLQNANPVLRNGRQVISVRSNFKGRIPGIIHEYSQSGHSFYLEPEAIVVKNNELVRAELEYRQELSRVLSAATAEVAAEAVSLVSAYTGVLELDCTAAAAQWGRSQQAVFAREPEDGASFMLHQARHPLLSRPVPIDIRLSAEDTMVIITGPNTGGKTVSLKTAALFVLLNQTGWPVPAGEQTRLPLFENVYCAIGDEQSLDTSLSTFSASMQTIASILETADAHSLVLLDELGSGTDPQEGAALAMAILDELLSRRSRVFVTSHHGVLKNYGFTKKGCVNASVVFEPDSFRPSYRIAMGIPGESHAVHIAAQNGIPESIINAARGYIEDRTADAAALIQGLIEKHEKLAVFEKEKEAAEHILREKQRQCDLKALQLRQKEFALRNQGYKRLEQLFEKKRGEIENLVRFLREGELTKEKTGEAKNFFTEFAAELSQEQDALKTEREAIETAPRRQTADTAYPAAFHEGMEVFIPHLHRRGVIVRKEKRQWLVAMDTIRMSFSSDQLEVPAAAGNQLQRPPQRPPQVTIEAELHRESRPEFELRLLGMRVTEAEAALQKQLDLALMHNMQEFSIIHGKGNGVLQTMVQEKLAAASFIAEFSFARPEHGGTGKTIVRLR